METIGNIIQHSQPTIGQLTRQGKPLQRLSQVQILDFLAVHNPSEQQKYCGNVAECLFGVHSTLGQLGTTYGEDLPKAWLVPQLRDIAVFCGAGNKLDKQQYSNLAFLIYTDFNHLKTTEFMLFCHWFKAGKYGRFYGTVDPSIIMKAINTYDDERRALYVKREQELYELNKQKEKTMTWEEYLASTGQAPRPHPLQALFEA